MKSKKYILTALLGLTMLLNGCASSGKNAPVSERGSEMSLAVTSVAICDILDKFGYENVVGVPETSRTLPERYADIETIGAPMNPDLEIIKKISPDLVLSPKTLESSLSESYQTAGVNSAFLDLSSVESMYSAISSLGKLLECEEEAEALVNDYKEYMEDYQNGMTENPDILLLMTFPDGYYLVATENSYVGNLVKLAGGNNVYGADYHGDENGFVNINPEDIVQKDPDYIMVFAHYSQESAFAYMEREFAENQTWQYFDAVKEGKIIYLPSEYFGMSASLSWKDSLEYLKPRLLGEAE